MPLPFSLSLDRTAAVSLPEQLARGLREAVDQGQLVAGDALPSSRALAADLGVSRGTVVTAYDQLLAEAYLLAMPRSGVRVHPDLRHRDDARPPAVLPRPEVRRRTDEPTTRLVDLTPGRVRIESSTDPAWNRAWRAALTEPAADNPDPQGDSGFRQALSTHTRTVRGMSAEPAAFFVTAGARDGLIQIVRTLEHARGRRVRCGVETPGFPGLRHALERSGTTLVPLPSDDVGPLPPTAAVDLVLLTPNHQFPYGTPMPAHRRQLLLTWASSQDTLIVEDDYDSEFRHLGPVLPTLRALDPAHVAHVGTFVGILGRHAPTGYVVAPEHLMGGLVETRRATGTPVAPLLQRAMAHYLDAGGLRRRLARAQRRLRANAREVASWIERQEPDGVTDTGQLLVIERTHAETERILTECRAAGFGLGRLADGWAARSPRHGVTASYASLDTPTLRSALSAISDATWTPSDQTRGTRRSSNTPA